MTIEIPGNFEDWDKIEREQNQKGYWVYLFDEFLKIFYAIKMNSCYISPKGEQIMKITQI